MCGGGVAAVPRGTWDRRQRQPEGRWEKVGALGAAELGELHPTCAEPTRAVRCPSAPAREGRAQVPPACRVPPTAGRQPCPARSGVLAPTE